MARTLADHLVERLISWEVDTVFGYPGDGVNGIFEALRTRQDKIQFIQVRHEEAAAFAACGYAKFTGRLGVCLATSGPGGIHLLNGLYDAKCDSQPVLAITGHTFHDLVGTQYQQDVDLVKLFIDVASYNERAMGPAHLVNILDEAIRTSLARRTVTHITIPKDMQEWTTSDQPTSSANIARHSGKYCAGEALLPPYEDMQRAADLINAGKRIAILAGRGCLDAANEIIQFAERVGAPIIKALLGKAVVPDDHPYTTGGIGLLGTAPSQDAMRACDTLVIAGSNFPYLEFYPKPGRAKCVQIDIDPSRCGLRYPVDVGLAGSCQRVLAALLPLIDPKEDRSFIQAAQSGMKQWNELLHERGTRDDLPMKPQVVVHSLNKYLDHDAIVAVDCGTVTTWAARHIKMRGSMQFSASGLLATMGNALPYAVAAAVAYPGRQVVAIVGDGGLSMLLSELATVAKYDLPVKVVVMKNNSLGQIKWEQIVFEGNPEFGVDLHPIDFAACARACGIAGYSVDHPAKIEDAIREAVELPGPALIDALIDANEPPMPGHATMQQAWQFAKAMLRGESERLSIMKTVLKNKVREVV
ncbi:MAG: thiamine pyrophosphate-binding protein [Pirellulales bacterium]